MIYLFQINFYFFIFLNIIYILVGIGDWGLGIGDWGLGPIPNPQSPNPQYIINNLFQRFFKIIIKEF